MKLTHANYYEKNKYLTNSKISDYLKDPYYFYQKHIQGIIEKKITDPMIIGSAVDTWLTQGYDVFKKKYDVVTRRVKTSEVTPYEYQLNNTMYSQIEAVCKAVENTTLYKSLKTYDRQVILQVDKNIGRFNGLAGQLDFLKVQKNKAIIIDLKTSQEASQQKYYYKCLDMGYFRQASMYRYLVHKIYNIPKKNIEFYHLVVEKELYKTYLYRFPTELLDDFEQQLNDIVLEISQVKRFKKHNLKWSDVKDII